MNQFESSEDYLERILMLSKNGTVRAIDIANDMNFSKPSVSIALKKLKNKNLIKVDESSGHIFLTEEGYSIACKILERHEVISSFLIKIGVSEEIALEDACKIEHDLSNESFEKIKNFVNKL